MVSIFMNNKVIYLCSCGSEKPITKLYFCRFCVKLRCGECSSHEVDSNYCPNCLEYMPSQEARVKKNRCANCLDCPICFHTLSTRTTPAVVASPSAGDPGTPVGSGKVHYLFCGFCRWTSRDASLPDQPVARGGWQEVENPNATRINILLEHYRLVAQREKVEKERRKISQKVGILHFSKFARPCLRSPGFFPPSTPPPQQEFQADKYGISPVVAKKLAGLTPNSKEGDGKLTEELVPPEATEIVEELSEDLLTTPPDLSKVSSLAQRLRRPDNQAPLVANLLPQHKYLLIKKSLRCKGCDHNLSKPEYNPASIKFKLYLGALYHLPEIKIKTLPTLLYNKPCRVEITLTNPTNTVMLVSLTHKNDHPSLTAQVEVGNKELSLAAKDDTAEYDDLLDNPPAATVADDAEIVSFRKANKLGVYLRVTPLIEKGDVKVALQVKHDLWNANHPQTDPQKIWMDHVVILNLGQL